MWHITEIWQNEQNWRKKVLQGGIHDTVVNHPVSGKNHVAEEYLIVHDQACDKVQDIIYKECKKIEMAGSMDPWAKRYLKCSYTRNESKRKNNWQNIILPERIILSCLWG